MNRVLVKSAAVLFCTTLLMAMTSVARAGHGNHGKNWQLGEGWYCVKMPTHGQTGATKRDNNIQLRVMVKSFIHGIGYAGQWRTGYFDIAGNIIRDDYNGSYGKQKFKHGGRNVCVPMHIIQHNLKEINAGIHEIWIQVKHGWREGKCPVVLGRDSDTNHFFKIWQRRGDLIHPFSCGHPRPGIDSPWPGVKNLHEQQKKGKVPPQIWFSRDNRKMPWKEMLFGKKNPMYKPTTDKKSLLISGVINPISTIEWFHLPSVGTNVKERAGWNRKHVQTEWYKKFWGGGY